MRTVAIIAGGTSSEHEVSRWSGERVLESLDRRRYRPLFVLIEKDGNWIVDGIRRRGPLGGVEALQAAGVDAAFLALHGPFGAPTIVLVSLGAAHLPAPSGAVGSLFVDPGSIVASFPVVLTGQDLSVNVTFQLPPSLLGLENTLITVQAFTGGVLASGAWFAQNPAFLLLRG